MTTAMERAGQPQQLAQRKELDLAAVVEMTGYSLPEVALIRHNMSVSMRVAPEDVPFIDVAMFCRATKSLGLDPLVKQAYWIGRKSRQQIDGAWQDVIKGQLQIGIDGFRAIADRAGNYAGSSEPVFRGRIEWKHRGNTLIVPEYCQVTTWKIVGGHRGAFTGEARWVEYVPKVEGAGAESDVWAKMPFNQLAKCAEGQSLRKGWALQFRGVEFSADAGEASEGELPTVAEPSPVQIQEMPQQGTHPPERPPRRQMTADDYDRIVAAEYEAQDSGWKSPPKQPEPATGSTASVASAPAASAGEEAERPAAATAPDRDHLMRAYLSLVDDAERDIPEGEFDRNGWELDEAATAEEITAAGRQLRTVLERARSAKQAPSAEQKPPEDPKVVAVLRNRVLVQEAFRAKIRGLGPLTADDTWPLDPINKANAALERKIRDQNGDARLAAAQDAVLQ
jgi:phage recombination protein Bet